MKRSSIFTTLCLLLAGASCTNDEVFYATSYTVVRVEAFVETETATPEGQPEPAIVTTVREEVLANAPVAAGGSYSLDFVKHNGGILAVRPGTGGEQIQGVFLKTPGTETITFLYGERDYTCTLTSYQDEDGQRKVLLAEDLTEHYKTLYPTAKFKQVLRREYTSHNSK